MKNLISQEAYEAALARGRAEMEKPHAVSARFVTRTSQLAIQFSNGIQYVIDVRQAPHLKDVPLVKLQGPHVTAGGDGLIFDEADLALNLPTLLAHYVPLDVARSRVAAESGRVSTASKARAARENGAKGGRPRKVFERAKALSEKQSKTPKR